MENLIKRDDLGVALFSETPIFCGEQRVMFVQLLEIMKDPQPLTSFFVCLTKSRPRDHEKPSCHHQPQ